MTHYFYHNKKTPTVSLVILTWNSANYIKKCIESYALSFEEQSVVAEFVIVDNGSTDSTMIIIEQEVKNNLPACCSIFLIKLASNHGTTISRNIGITKSQGKFIVICDSDTEFVQGHWEALFNIVKKKDIGLIAPSLFYEDGTVQPSVKKFPTLIDKLWKIPRILFNFPIGNKDFYEDFPWSCTRSVDTAISACWILSKDTIEKIGLLDEKIFYSPEDIDYCLRIWEGGKKVIYYPDMKLIHHTQQITHKRPFCRQSISHFKGLLYYFIKHGYFLSRYRLYKRLSQ